MIKLGTPYNFILSETAKFTQGVFMVFFRSLRLMIANIKWQETIEEIRETGDYGMCCNEEMAIQCAKEYHFGKLIKYADKYKPK